MRILAFAYACEPGRGSEPAVGWTFAGLIGSIAEIWVLTRTSNRLAIERELADRDLAARQTTNVHFVYVDPPRRWTRWKRGQRGVRLYYMLWQIAALREARRLVQAQGFDAAWHLTFANAWLGSTASLLRLPFVYGPVGGGVTPPVRLVGTLGFKGALYEVLRALARMAGRYANPLARMSWRRAVVILVQNEETLRWLPGRHRHKAVIFPNVVLDRLPAATQCARPFGVMLFVGRLVPLKGVTLALRALRNLRDWRLVVCGDGPDRKRLRLIARRYGVLDRVEFRGWIEREQVLRAMRDDAAVLVFPSLHDEAGWVVIEAMATGLPVVCLDVGGPPLLSGRQLVVTPAGPRLTADRIATRVMEAIHLDGEAVWRQAQQFSTQRRLRDLACVLEAVGGGHGRGFDSARNDRYASGGDGPNPHSRRPS